MSSKPTLPTTPAVSTEEKSLALAALFDEKQGEDIVVIDVTGVCPIAESIIVVTGRGQRHAQSLADAAVGLAKTRKFPSFGVEGYETGSWILVDLNDVIIHIFQDDARRFYNIEGLWAEGKRMDAPRGVLREAEEDF